MLNYVGKRLNYKGLGDGMIIDMDYNYIYGHFKSEPDNCYAIPLYQLNDLIGKGTLAWKE